MPLPLKKRFVKIVCFSVFLITMLQACFTGRSRQSDAVAIKDQPRSEFFEESQKVFADQNPMIVSHMGELELKVRMATPAEIPEDYYKFWLLAPVEGAGSLAYGLAAAPMFGSALVVGGVFLIPLGSYGYLHEKGIWDSINEALSNAEFTRAIEKAMRDRLGTTFAENNMPNVMIEIIIQTFGITNSSSKRYPCFVVLADVIFRRDNAEVKRDHLEITDANRSEDAPPPQCASLEHFAKNKAMLVKNTLAEYAEVLAAMAIDRIP